MPRWIFEPCPCCGRELGTVYHEVVEGCARCAEAERAYRQRFRYPAARKSLIAALGDGRAPSWS